MNSYLDPIITPGVKSKYGTTAETTQTVYTTTNTGTRWSIEQVCLKCDVCTSDNALNNSYVEHLLSGKALL